MSRARAPENIEIASLKKKQSTVVNFMASGPGTPWEDRGTHGTAGAFFKTSFASLFGVGKLVQLIRRPETTNDARSLVFGYSAIWGATGLLHYAIRVWQQSRVVDAEVDRLSIIIIYGVLIALACGPGSYILFRIYNRIYGQLIAQEKGSGLVTAPVVYNINAYAMGPSVLAIVPYIGPPLAGLMIFINLILVGKSRLQLRPAAAVIDAIVGYAAVLGIILAGWGIGYAVLWKILGYAAVTVVPPMQRVVH